MAARQQKTGGAEAYDTHSTPQHKRCTRVPQGLRQGWNHSTGKTADTDNSRQCTPILLAILPLHHLLPVGKIVHQQLYGAGNTGHTAEQQHRLQEQGESRQGFRPEEEPEGGVKTKEPKENRHEGPRPHQQLILEAYQRDESQHTQGQKNLIEENGKKDANERGGIHPISRTKENGKDTKERPHEKPRHNSSSIYYSLMGQQIQDNHDGHKKNCKQPHDGIT